jgi:hypothetical protein
LTLATYFIAFKHFKRLFSLAHFVGILIFLIPVTTYVLAYSTQGDSAALLNKLLTESSSRTVASKSILESIGHLFVFPVRFIIDILPWGIFLLVFLKKEIRKHVWKNAFLKACLLVFMVNIVLYWLSPEYRARYVFMLLPFLLFPTFAGLKLVLPKLNPNLFKVFAILALLGFFTMPIFVQRVLPEISFKPLIILAPLMIAVTYYLWNASNFRTTNMLYAIVAILVVIRITYSSFMVPFRVETGPYQREKTKALEMVTKTKSDSLFMYYSNVALTMNWYLSSKKQQMVNTKRDNFDLNQFYLVPNDVMIDQNNVQVFDTFVRRSEHKPFSLVKFKNHFPKKTKKR